MECRYCWSVAAVAAVILLLYLGLREGGLKCQNLLGTLEDALRPFWRIERYPFNELSEF